MSKTFVIVLILVAIALAACAPGSLRFEQKERPAGFFWGIWHGWIAPVSLIWHLFNPSIRIYETNNVGWLYDLGFYIAVVGGFGGFALSRKKCKD